jgi:hypothetical protein
LQVPLAANPHRPRVHAPDFSVWRVVGRRLLESCQEVRIGVVQRLKPPICVPCRSRQIDKVPGLCVDDVIGVVPLPVGRERARVARRACTSDFRQRVQISLSPFANCRKRSSNVSQYRQQRSSHSDPNGEARNLAVYTVSAGQSDTADQPSRTAHRRQARCFQFAAHRPEWLTAVRLLRFRPGRRIGP